MTTDLGRLHVPVGASVEYEFCPPTSGTHFTSSANQAPLRRDFYGPDAAVRPGGWVHNLEHGYVVVAYRGGANGATAEEQAQIRTFFETAPASGLPNSCPSVPNKVIVVRFDEMDTKFAVLSWDRALLSDTWDSEEAGNFYEQWVDSEQSPERGAC